MWAPAPATRRRGVRVVTRFSRTHLSDPELLHSLHASVAGERASTADVLAHIAEVDARQLYLLAAYPSMYAYCVRELNLSEDAAYKRIQAARRVPACGCASSRRSSRRWPTAGCT